jgi:hypothetical protein
MKALVLNTVGRGFDFENVDIAPPIGREVLVDVRASGLCHTDRIRRNPMTAIMDKATIETLTTHYIDGAFVESHGREVMDIIKPTNGQVIGRAMLETRKIRGALLPRLSVHSPVSAGQRRKSARVTCASYIRLCQPASTI